MERVCSRCGEPVSADDRFCPQCGAHLPEVALGDPARRGWRPILWTWVPLAIVAAALIVTNPSTQAYAGWLASQVAAGALGPRAEGPQPNLAAAIARGTIAKDDLFFTIFDTRVRGVRVDTLGILDRFIPLGTSPVR